VSEFLDRALHDLLGPLSSILLWDDLLRVSGEDTVRRREAITAIHGSVRLMARQIHDMLDLVRAKDGRLLLASEPLSVEAVAQAVVTEARERGLAVEARVRPGQILGDAPRIRQMIDRMVHAVAAASTALVVVTVAIEAHHVVVDVRQDFVTAPDETLEATIESQMAAEIAHLHGGSFALDRRALRAQLPRLDDA